MRVVARSQTYEGVLPPLAPDMSGLKSGVGPVEFRVATRAERGKRIGEEYSAWVGGKKVASLLTRERTEGCPPGMDCFELAEEVEPGWRGKGIGGDLIWQYSNETAKRYHSDDVGFFLLFTEEAPWWRRFVRRALEDTGQIYEESSEPVNYR